MRRARFNPTFGSGIEPKLVSACAALLLGCAAPRALPVVDEPSARVEERAAGFGSTPPTPAPPSSPAVVTAPTSLPLEIAVDKVLAVSVSSIALGEGSRIAVLGNEPYVIDIRGARSLPLPNAFRAKPEQREELRIFFGRDNEPRIMGTRRAESGESPVYCGIRGRGGVMVARKLVS
jgi:hypothetical protein